MFLGQDFYPLKPIHTFACTWKQFSEYKLIMITKCVFGYQPFPCKIYRRKVSVFFLQAYLNQSRINVLGTYKEQTTFMKLIDNIGSGGQDLFRHLPVSRGEEK